MKTQILSILLATALLQASKDKETPTPDNQKPVEINADINTQTTWKNIVTDPTKPDYIIKKSQLQVNETLIIEPGVVVAFEADGMMRLPITSNGYIQAKGTPTNPIRFTGVVATPGSWRGILILSPDDRNEFDFCIFEYGGGAVMQTLIPQSTLAVHTQSAVNGKLRLTNSIIRNSAAHGFILGKSAILNTFSKNTFSNNVNAGVQLPPSMVSRLDEESVYNTENGAKVVEILGEDLNELTMQTWKYLGLGVFYRVIGDINIQTGLSIAAGATFEMSTNTIIRVRFPNGYLIAQGTNQNRISFQGNSNAKGTWKGFLFNSSDTRNEMSYCNISNGGGQSMFTGLAAANIGLITQSGNTGRAKITTALFRRVRVVELPKMLAVC